MTSSMPADAQLSEDRQWWWDEAGQQWHPVAGQQGYEESGAGGASGGYEDGGTGSAPSDYAAAQGEYGQEAGAGGAPSYDTGAEGYGGEPSSDGQGLKEGDEGFEELVHQAIEHGSTHVVDTIVHGTFHIAEGAFTLFVMVVQIALGPGDTAMHEVHRYVACCDGDHNGANWQGQYHVSEAEAADDIARHNYEWPGHAAGEVSEKL